MVDQDDFDAIQDIADQHGVTRSAVTAVLLHHALHHESNEAPNFAAFFGETQEALIA